MACTERGFCEPTYNNLREIKFMASGPSGGAPKTCAALSQGKKYVCQPTKEELKPPSNRFGVLCAAQAFRSLLGTGRGRRLPNEEPREGEVKRAQPGAEGGPGPKSNAEEQDDRNGAPLDE